MRAQLAWALLLSGASAAQGRMNVLFLASDDLRYQLGVSGPGWAGPGCEAGSEGRKCTKMLTPNIDRLAAMSLMCHKNYVQQAVCSPTRTSLLTSRRPDATRVWDLYSYFRTVGVGGNYTTIPQLFREHGYYTQGQGKIFHPGHASNHDDQQFSWSVPYTHVSGEPYFPDPYEGPHSWLIVNKTMEKQYPLSDTQIADSAISQLKSAKHRADGGSSIPFFIAVGFHRPHLPFVAPQAFYDLYPADSVELPTNQLPPKNMPPVAWSNSGELVHYGDIDKIRNGSGIMPGQTLPPTTVRELRRGYYASVSYLDSQLGRVLDSLIENGFLNNTVISFWGDHGWQLGEHGEWCKHTNFELATHAPLMIRVPGMTDGGLRTMMYTEHIDLMPTLAEAAMDVTVPPCPRGAAVLMTEYCTMGTSLVPLMSAPDKPVRAASFSQYPRGYQRPDGSAVESVQLRNPKPPQASPCLTRNCTMGYSIVTRHAGTEYRYTEWVDFAAMANVGPWARQVGVELYDHGVDMEENINVFDDPAKAQIVAALSEQLHRGPTTGGGWGPWQK